LRCKKSENRIPAESVLAWPQLTAPNRLRTLSDLAVTDAHLSDRDCLDLATDIVRRHPERWREFQALVLERGWHAAAMVAAVDCQVPSMRLPPWREGEIPCLASSRGTDRAARLLRRMLRRGVSRWHPRPLEALAEAGAPVR
jgi:hypothetical protein